MIKKTPVWRNRTPESKELAIAARQNASVAEEVAWRVLRNSRLGFKFRREHAIGPYRLDFYCAEAKFSLELDGDQHDPEADRVRDEYFASIGIETMRISTREFLGMNVGEADPFTLQRIREACERRSGRKVD